MVKKAPPKGDVFTVNKVLRARRKKGKLSFFVSWEGYSARYNSWVPEENVLDKDLLRTSAVTTMVAMIDKKKKPRRVAKKSAPIQVSVQFTINDAAAAAAAARTLLSLAKWK